MEMNFFFSSMSLPFEFVHATAICHAIIISPPVTFLKEIFYENQKY